MEIILHLGEIKTKPVPKNDAFKEFRIGECIKVQWNEKRGMERESYRAKGTIVQITGKLICYRCSAGYVCCVSANQMASGTQVAKKGVNSTRFVASLATNEFSQERVCMALP